MSAERVVARASPGRDAGSVGEPAGRAWTWDGVRYCLLVFVGLRVGLFLLGLVATAVLPPDIKPVGVPGWPAHATTPGPHNVFTAWERFDGLWFLRIAAHGYRSGDGSAAFFPLYPLVTRLVSTVIGGHPFAASLIVSNASFAGALVVLYLLVAGESSEPVARRTVLYTALFPTSFFFLAPYSESLFLLLSVGAFLAARRRRWPLAGLLGALAAATRNVGILLAPALAIEALRQVRTGEGRAIWPKLAWSGSVGVGTFAYLLYWKAFSGDWLAPLHQQVNWQRVWSPPWRTIWLATKDAYRYLGAYAGGYHQIDWLLVVPALALVVVAMLRLPPAYGVYAFGSAIVSLSLIFEPRPFMSDPRFFAVVFPIPWALALLTEERTVPHQLTVAVSAAWLGLLTVLFVNWYYIF